MFEEVETYSLELLSGDMLTRDHSFEHWIKDTLHTTLDSLDISKRKNLHIITSFFLELQCIMQRTMVMWKLSKYW